MASRTSKISNRLKKTLSGGSSLHRAETSESNRDDNASLISDSESLVISSVGETLRRNTGEIKSGVLA
jgi:hypothetical protein